MTKPPLPLLPKPNIEIKHGWGAKRGRKKKVFDVTVESLLESIKGDILPKLIEINDQFSKSPSKGKRKRDDALRVKIFKAMIAIPKLVAKQVWSTGDIKHKDRRVNLEAFQSTYNWFLKIYRYLRITTPSKILDSITSIDNVFVLEHIWDSSLTEVDNSTDSTFIEFAVICFS